MIQLIIGQSETWKRRVGGLAVLGLLSGSAASVARADTQPVAAYDARSVGMGGVGAGLVDGAAAMYHNPAALEGIDQFSGTLVVTPVMPMLEAPLAGPGTEQSATSSFFPIGLIGAAFRPANRVVIGIGSYLLNGSGATYEDVAVIGGNDIKLGGVSGEVAVAASVRLVDGLSVAVSQRTTCAIAQADTYVPNPATGSLSHMEQDLFGVSALGFGAGVHYKSPMGFRAGLYYMSKTRTELSGTTEMDGAEFKTSTDSYSPHTFRLGGSYNFLGRRATVAADLRYALNSESHESATMTMEVTPGVMMESTSELNWKNAWVASAGGEYFVTERVPVRAGYALQHSATPEDTATSYFRPPGLGHSVHLGTGLRLANLDLDVAGYYSFASTDVESGPTAGHYSLDQLAFSVGGSYHF